MQRITKIMNAVDTNDMQGSPFFYTAFCRDGLPGMLPGAGP